MENLDTAEGDVVSCHLCGLPVGSTGAKERIGNEAVSFCCHGCQQVFLLLSAATGVLPENFQESELYRVCVESGIISGPDRDHTEEPGPIRTDLPPLELTYRVGGMWCPSCAWLLEEILRRTPGVIRAKVTFVSDVLTLKYLPTLVSPMEIVSRVQRLGYRLSTFQTSAASGEKGLILRLGIASILTANIMMISLAVYSGFFRENLPDQSALFFLSPARHGDFRTLLLRSAHT